MNCRKCVLYFVQEQTQLKTDPGGKDRIPTCVLCNTCLIARSSGK
jgi:hypothetical protein